MSNSKKTSLLQAIQDGATTALVQAAIGGGFCYQPRLNRLTASNNYLDLESLSAYSYGHWNYVRRIDGLLVFNWFGYSMTTRKHQRNMSEVLRKLGVSPDVCIQDVHSLHMFSSLSGVAESLRYQIVQLNGELAKCVRAVSNKRSDIEHRIARVSDELQGVLDYMAIRNAQAAGGAK